MTTPVLITTGGVDHDDGGDEWLIKPPLLCATTQGKSVNNKRASETEKVVCTDKYM
jgi:hypothetical protein